MKEAILFFLFFGLLPIQGQCKDPVAEKFYSITSKILNLYGDNLRKPLGVTRDWKSDSLDALARDEGDSYYLYISGGLLRSRNLTEDAFVLLVCHEMGHLAGGGPLFGDFVLLKSNLSIEGQADYWAASKCFRTFYKGENNVQFVKDFVKKNSENYFLKDIIPISLKKCQTHWKTRKDVALCRRTIFAGRSFSEAIRLLSNKVRFYVNITTPSKLTPEKTYPLHPAAQCRFDTIVAAALCTIPPSEKVSFQNIEDGVCSQKKNHIESARPRCWFNPDKPLEFEM